MDRLPFAKPVRIVDPELLRAYCRWHPACEVEGCRRRPTPEPHHLVPRSRGRSDLHENLLRLCPTHHRAWHTLGGLAWWRRYGDRLLEEARGKVARALGLAEAAITVGRREHCCLGRSQGCGDRDTRCE